MAYLDLIADLPLGDESKWNIPFAWDKSGFNALAVAKKREDLGLFEALIRFGDRLDVDEDKKVQGYSGTRGNNAPLLFALMSDDDVPPEKIAGILDIYLKSGLSENGKAVLAAGYFQGTPALEAACHKGRLDKMAAYERAVKSIKSHPAIQEIFEEASTSENDKSK